MLTGMPGSEDILVNNEKEEEDAEKKMKAGLAKVEEKDSEIDRWRGDGEAMERLRSRENNPPAQTQKFSSFYLKLKRLEFWVKLEFTTKLKNSRVQPCVQLSEFIAQFNESFFILIFTIV